jgi:hypothetical protein
VSPSIEESQEEKERHEVLFGGVMGDAFYNLILDFGELLVQIVTNAGM